MRPKAALLPTTNHDDGLLEICEVFRSIAGETTHAGRPALFVRLSRCNLRCGWCDTKKAWDPGSWLSVNRLLELIRPYDQRLIIITGGEPLLQANTVHLCSRLLDKGYEVLVETNGSMDIIELPDNVSVIMDIKTPGSGQSGKMCFENLGRLRKGDELKIVVGDQHDFDWALKIVEQNKISPHVPVVFSPVAKVLDPQELAEWVLHSDCKIRIQLQIHKILWPDGKDGYNIQIS